MSSSQPDDTPSSGVGAPRELWRAGPAWLFCPGHRSDLWPKAARAADVVIVDLEDAVPASEKAEARRDVVAALARGDLDPASTMVRVNGAGTPWSRPDIEALGSSSEAVIMVPKAELPLGELGLGPHPYVALCESAQGIMEASAIASTQGCVGIAWGGQDLAAALGAVPLSPCGDLDATGQYARAMVRFAAAAANVPAIDTVRTRYDDDVGLAAEATAAAAMGFAAKLLIHPRQVAVVRDAFAPTEAQIAWAHQVRTADMDGVGRVKAEMVDAPVRERARAILDRAARSPDVVRKVGGAR